MSTVADRIEIRLAGETALMVDLADAEEVLGLREALLADPALPRGVDLVPGWRTLMLSRHSSRPATAAEIDKLADAILRAAERVWGADGEFLPRRAARAGDSFARPRSGGTPAEIRVRYDGQDLGAVAALTGLSEAEVVARHTAAVYVVAFLGFARGFPYLAGLDPSLRVSRLQTPRTRVPAGSVGIAGDQTGIYPMPSPGGWRLLGRTDQVLFDPDRDPPALLRPGSLVRFVAVSDPQSRPAT